MAFALIDGASAALIPDGGPFISGGVQYPGNVTALWSTTDLAAIGVLPVVEDAIPPGQVVTGYALSLSGSSVLRHWTLTPEPPPPVPSSVTNYQARTALRGAGLRDRVDTALRGADQSIPENAEALEAWDYANNFYRDQPFIISIGKTFGLSDADIDDLFRAASKVT